MSLPELAYALDTFYLLICAALVMWMAAGFSMLEAGLVRARNTAEILTKNVGLYAIACVTFLICGYGIMYGDSASSFIPGFAGIVGGTDHDVAALATEDAPTYSLLADFFFQVVFVATAMSIVSGAVAERMKLTTFFFFAIVMCALIYPVQGYWKWGGGFLHQAGFQDFAGSGVVHLCGAVAAVTGVLLLGPRAGKYDAKGRSRAIPGANLPLAALGTLVLWLGWFGFNGGSQLKISGVADANAVALIFVNTNMAAAGGAIAALVASKLRFGGKADLTMLLNGALAGLVAITAEPATPSPLAATCIGAAGGLLVFGSILLLDRLRVDDPVGAISVHGVAGIWGLLAVPITNPAASLGTQLVGAFVIVLWAGSMSLATWLALDRLLGIRVSREAELQGLDQAECGLEAYPEFTAGRLRSYGGRSGGATEADPGLAPQPEMTTDPQAVLR